jgi:hypothetical protein
MGATKWPFRSRSFQRYCTECGERMHRIKGLIYRADYDSRTGRRAWVWYWGCKDGFTGWHRTYLDGRPYHDATRIPTSPVRAALERIDR